MNDQIRKNLPFALDAALLLALLTLAGKFAGWQASIDERMRHIEAQQATSSIVQPQEARRLSVLETRMDASDRAQAELKSDIVRRLDRQDQKLDAIAERIDRLRSGQ